MAMMIQRRHLQGVIVTWGGGGGGGGWELAEILKSSFTSFKLNNHP